MLLCWARLLIKAVAFGRWRSSLGYTDPSGDLHPLSDSAFKAELLAKCVARASVLLPFQCTCLTQGMALSWMLRRTQVPHVVVFAARPLAARTEQDVLHAWVEHCGAKILGDLPGPWSVTLRMGEERRR